MRVGRREAGRLCDQIGYSWGLDRRSSDLRIGRVLKSVSSLVKTDEVRVGHRRSLRGCTRGCWRSFVPRVDLRTRDWGLREQHKVLLLLLLVVERILILSQRLLGRGRGKPCLLLLIRGERRDVERGNVGGGKRT